MKQNKGITLIALVVTIIVLLILAGVAIAMLTGDNSILKRAQSTKAYNIIGAVKDEVSTAYNAAYAEMMKDMYDDGVATANKKGMAVCFYNELNNNKIPAAAENTAAATGSHGAKVVYSGAQDTVDSATAQTVKVVVTIDGKVYQCTGQAVLNGTSSTFTWGSILGPLDAEQ